MRIVIPADGEGLEATTSPNFARCSTFVFVDSATLEVENVENPAADAATGAGIQAAQTVIDHGAEAIISPQLGPNAFRPVQAAGIVLYVLKGRTVREAVEAFNRDELKLLTTDAGDHAGIGGARTYGV